MCRTYVYFENLRSGNILCTVVHVYSADFLRHVISQIGNIGCFVETIFVDQGFTVDHMCACVSANQHLTSGASILKTLRCT